jgi:hypothetical protein
VWTCIAPFVPETLRIPSLVLITAVDTADTFFFSWAVMNYCPSVPPMKISALP